MTDVDWGALRTAAREAMARAYAPYSGYALSPCAPSAGSSPSSSSPAAAG